MKINTIAAMSQTLATIAFSLAITGPIFIVLLLGWLFKRLHIITPAFIAPASNLVFKVGLPTIMFLSVYRADSDNFSMGMTLWILLPLTLLVFVFAGQLARWIGLSNADRGVFIQGAFRSNLGIISLAFCSNTYGDAGLAAAALPVAVLTILYNVLAVLALSPIHASVAEPGFTPQSASLLAPQLQLKTMLSRTLKNVITNPLIIGISMGFLMKFSGLVLPQIVERSSDYFAAMTLPLALLCIGASINIKSLRSSQFATLLASMIKMLLAPLMAVTIAAGLGLRGMELGVLFFLSAAPTATASFIQVKALGGNGELAANMVVMSTLLGLLTMTAGLSLLKAFALIAL